MAHHENHPSAVPDPYQPLIQVNAGPGNSAGHELVQAGPYASPNFVRTPPVVNGGMDGKWFLHSLRRRWLLATTTGLILGAAAAFGLYWAFPESSNAVARFQVKSEQDVLFKRMDETTARSYDIFKATQMAVVKSPTVLNYAKDDAALRNIKAIQEAENPLTWLDQNINVAFEGESEYMRISLKLKESAENLKAIVNAVCEAYNQEVVSKHQTERQLVRDALAKNLRDMNEEIRSMWDEYRQKVKDQGAFEGDQDPQVRILVAKIGALQAEGMHIDRQIREMQEQFQYYRMMEKSPAMLEAKISMAMSTNMDAQAIEYEMYGVKAQLRKALQRSRNQETRETRRLQKQLASLQESKAAIAAEVRQQIASQDANSPNYERAAMEMKFRIGMSSLVSRRKQIDEELIPAAIADLKERSTQSTDLMIQMSDIEQLEAVAADMKGRIEAWNIELNAPPRIKLVESATVTPGINTAQRYTIAGLGGVVTMVLCCLGIAYVEFLGRRLNGPSQVDEGLGIRVVGTLPSLNAKKMSNPRHVAQLSESIDNVRTALMHESTSKPRQVVLVTSPAAMEGRTIVASQLAASLARAGRRTLLIDGDIRRPALHTLFGVPLEDGLCEVLRTEAEVTDVVRATQAEGLWLMTAGYCDADAVHAMATDQIQPIFEKLRSDYDFVIIDGAPVLGLSDSLMIGQHCDGVLLSVLRDQSAVPKIYQATELLRSVGIRMIGAVVNGVSASSDRRVTHLQVAAPKSSRKQLESTAVE